MSKKGNLMVLAGLFIVTGALIFFFSSSLNDYFYNIDQHQIDNIDKNVVNYTFAVYGDSRNSSGHFESMLKNVNTKNVLFSVHDGDMVFTGTREEFNKYLNQNKISNVPVLAVIGNHELYPEKGSSKNFTDYFGPTYYSFNNKNAYFIILDDSLNEVNKTQMDWLNKELSKAQNYQYRFVFLHSPLYDPSKGQYVQGHSISDPQNAKELNDVFDKNNVTMIFTSHVHGYYNGTWGKTPFILTGGAGAPLDKGDPEHEFYHYILVHVTNKDVSYELIKYT